MELKMAPETETTTTTTTEIQSAPKEKRKRNKLFMSQVAQQLEFYFSDTNLHKDRFMKEAVLSSSSEPRGNPVAIETLLSFNKLKSMGATSKIIKGSLKKSKILRLGDDGDSVQRSTPIQEPKNVDERTVYVENIPSSSSHDSLRQIFSRFGSVVYVSLPRFKQTRDLKGFAFVEFDDEEGARRAATGVFTDAGSGKQKPARLPVMNRAMAALARANREGADAAEDKTAACASSKRRRTASEGEKETAGAAAAAAPAGENEEEAAASGPKVKRRRRRGRSISLSVENEAPKSSENSVAEKEDSASKICADDAEKCLASKLKKLKRKKSAAESETEAPAPVAAKKARKDGRVKKEGRKTEEDARKERKEEGRKTEDDARGNIKEKEKKEEGGKAREREGKVKSEELEERKETEEGKKKPKNRRKKIDKRKKGKSKKEAPSAHRMKVMPKKEWEALRNEYLTLQRQRMSALKQNLTNARTDAEAASKMEEGEVAGVGRAPPQPPLPTKDAVATEQIPGVIVKVESKSEDQTLPPRSILKNSFEKETLSKGDEAEGFVKIAYMDMEEGRVSGHIRCCDPASASRILSLGLAGYQLSLVTGADEDAYWEKVRLCRAARKAGGGKKGSRAKNGMKRLVERASAGKPNKAAGPTTHVRFDD